MRQEKLLLEGLRALLTQIEEVDDDDGPAPVARGRSPARSASPNFRVSSRSPPAARSESPGWQCKGSGKTARKGKGGKGQGTASPAAPVLGAAPAATFRAPSPKRVGFASQADDADASLLAKLKALLVECEVHGTRNLRARLGSLLEVPVSTPTAPARPAAPAATRTVSLDKSRSPELPQPGALCLTSRTSLTLNAQVRTLRPSGLTLSGGLASLLLLPRPLSTWTQVNHLPASLSSLLGAPAPPSELLRLPRGLPVQLPLSALMVFLRMTVQLPSLFRVSGFS